MSAADRIIYSRPEEPQIYVTKEAVEGLTCAACGSTDIATYPIAWVRGPRIAVKCQQCYEPVSVERPGPDVAWPPFRALAWDWEVSVAERPNRG